MRRRLIAALAGFASLLPGLAAAAPAVDLKAIDAVVGKADLVVLGEDSHGMREVHEMVPVIFEHLVRTKGLRLFVFESAWALDDVLKDFMASDRTTVSGDESFVLNAFNSPPIVEMLIWIRQWNREHPKDPIHIAGYQPEQPVTDVAALRKAFPGPETERLLAPCKAGAAEFTSNIGFISKMGARLRKEKLPIFTPEERSACLAGLDALDRRATGEAKLHVLSLRTYVAVLSATLDSTLAATDPRLALSTNTAAYDEGDRVRSVIFEDQRKRRYGDAKAFLWMHNWHGMKKARDVGMGEARMPSIATRLAERHGKRLVAIGNVVPCGAECTDPATSVETPFKAKFGDRVAVVDLRDPKQTEGLGIERSGTMLPNFHGGMSFNSVKLADQFDAVIYLPEASKFRP